MTIDITDTVGLAADPLGDTEDRRALRGTLRQLLARESPPERVRALDEASEYDHELHRGLGGLGLLAVGGPVELGGAGDVRDQIAVVEELASGPTTVAAMFVTQYIATQILGTSTVPEHRDALAAVMRGEGYVSFALSEADGGTDVARVMKTRATSVGGGYVLNGEKMWTSAATHASHIVVLADEHVGAVTARRHHDVRRAARRTGPEHQHDRHSRAPWLSTCILSFADVHVPEAHVLGGVDGGFRAVFPTLNRERLNSAAACCSVSRGGRVELARPYAEERTAFDRPIGGFQVLQHRLVDGFVALEEARGLLHRGGGDRSRRRKGRVPRGHGQAVGLVCRASRDPGRHAADGGCRLQSRAPDAALVPRRVRPGRSRQRATRSCATASASGCSGCRVSF